MRDARNGWLRLGNRGTVLLCIGILWIVNGWLVYKFPAPNWRPRVLHEYLPVVLREVVWIATGIVAVMAAFLRKPGQDRWGWFALLIMPAERAVSWLGSALLWALEVPLAALFPAAAAVYPVPEIWICLSNGLVWCVVTFLLYRFSGWPESPVIIRVPS